jgi:predicted TIM-barrel fold metal-dependent hydrolase
VADLLVTNVATRYPDVRFISSHAGGTLVSIAQRIGA